LKTEIESKALELKAMSIITLLALFWGGNSPAMKIALENMPKPFLLAGLRFTLAVIAILGWAISKKVNLSIRTHEFLPLGILGIILAAQISTFNIGTNLSLAGRAALLINTHPFYVAVLTHFFIPSDRLTIRKIIGLLIAFLGIFLFFRDSFISDKSYLLGDIILFISAVILAIQAVYVKRVVQGINPVKLLFWQMIFALIPFYVMSFIFESGLQGNITFSVAGALIYQGIIVGAFCFVTWTTLLKKYSASKISAFLFMTPIFGAFLSFLILGEEITFWFSVAIVLVAVGIYIVNSSKN